MKLNHKTARLAVSAIALAAVASTASAGFLWNQSSTAVTPPTTQSAQVVPASTKGSYRDGSYTGPSIYQYYGYVQVRLNIKNGRISSVDILKYPRDYNTSIYINTHALPMLKSELLQAQNLHISGISGATLTSEAFYMSARAALKQATS